jgi:SAM-dependent methyltransferase
MADSNQGVTPAPGLDIRTVEQRRVWEEKPNLRVIYADFHKRLEAACPPGKILDIGGGSAHFKDYRPDIVSLDILPFEGIDVVADAHDMPFEAASFAGIVMLDVLHHLQRPVVFLREAARVLKPGGRLAMIEPGMSRVARHVYDRFHHEPADMSADPFAEQQTQSGDDPWDSNQAIPSLMFATAAARARVEATVPELKVVSVEWLALFAYPLSGGFKRWSLMPAGLVRPVLKVENALMPVLGSTLAFRQFIVLERRPV